MNTRNKVKTIAITSGKGGVGKSTITVLLANELIKKNKKVIICDCDVECPNDYLLLEQKLTKPKQEIYTFFPKLNKRKCKKCGLCVRTCKSNAIFQIPKRYPVFVKELCSGCGACWITCPHKAIERRKEKIGEIYVNKIRSGFYLITGVARPSLEETGKVVFQVKKFTLDLAKKINFDFVIFDTASGTHCPVISALLNCDLVYVITEPTPIGAHDLNLILKLCKMLNLKTKIILNQADLGDKKEVNKIAKKFNTRIEKEFFYSFPLAQVYSQGKLLDYFKNER